MRTRRSHRPEHLNDNWNSDTDDNSNDFDNGDRAGGPADLGRESGQEFGQEFGREGSRGGRRRGAGFRRRRQAFAASAGFGPRFAGQEFGPPDDEHDPDFGRRGPRGRGRGGPGRFGPGSGPGGFGPGGFGLGGPGGPGGPGGRGGRGGPGGHGPGGGRGRRARGNVRAAVLALLAEEPRHGYSIMTELAERSGGLWRPSPGSVYPVLQQLQDEKLVTAEESDGRKVFSITDAGRALIEANPGEFAEPWSVAGPGPRQRVQTLFEGMTALGSATQQVARLGTAAQAERARLVLDEARRALYRILAEDEEAAATPASPAANPAGEAAAPAKDDHAPPGE